MDRRFERMKWVEVQPICADGIKFQSIALSRV